MAKKTTDYRDHVEETVKALTRSFPRVIFTGFILVKSLPVNMKVNW
jgi:hypothetical protein